MANMDMKTATALVKEYNRETDRLSTFINSAYLVKDSISVGQEATLIRFLRTRLLGKALIGIPQNIVTCIKTHMFHLIDRCDDRQTRLRSNEHPAIDTTTSTPAYAAANIRRLK